MPTETLEPSLVAKVLALHDALDAAHIGHAFGGALALAYWTADPRATADVDVNISLPASRAGLALAALPDAIAVLPTDIAKIEADDQIRLWWGRTPVDLFFRAHSFHDALATRAVLREFAGRQLPFVCADDLAVLKSLFDRPKDWLDITAMNEHRSLSMAAVMSAVSDIVGSGDERLARLAEIGRAGAHDSTQNADGGEDE